MLYFITMQKMPVTLPCGEKDRLFDTTMDEINIAAVYAAFPSSQTFKYKVYFKYVDCYGKKIHQNPLYGLHADDMELFNTDTVRKIATSIQMVIALSTGAWYQYKSHSMPDANFAEVKNWAPLFTAYSRYFTINVNELEAAFFKQYNTYGSDFLENVEANFPRLKPSTFYNPESSLVLPSPPMQPVRFNPTLSTDESQSKKRKVDDFVDVSDFTVPPPTPSETPYIVPTPPMQDETPYIVPTPPIPDETPYTVPPPPIPSETTETLSSPITWDSVLGDSFDF